MFKSKINDIAANYHLQSKNQKGYKFIKNQHLTHYRDDIIKLKVKKVVEYQGKRIPLPLASPDIDCSFKEVLFNRESRRKFDSSPISLKTLATLLYYSNGFKQVQTDFGLVHKKFTPTSGGMNSVEVFAIVLSSNELKKGIYHYDSHKHEVVNLSVGDYSQWVQNDVFYQEEYARASVIFVLASTYEKLAGKYGKRSYRLSLLDIGHVSQNIYLIGAALNLQVCASAGYIDDELDEALSIDGLGVATFLTLMIGS